MYLRIVIEKQKSVKKIEESQLRSEILNRSVATRREHRVSKYESESNHTEKGLVLFFFYTPSPVFQIQFRSFYDPFICPEVYARFINRKETPSYFLMPGNDSVWSIRISAVTVP
ncbi:MAG TPA: hypothetical protein DIC22_02305 [Chitinophagaceae bacterium]|jgi:hypothetical protein|nr:hypothetical protein [Chitinophagaceae bacterium]